MNAKVDSLTVLRVIYSVFQSKKTLKTDLSYGEIHKEAPELDLDTIKAMVEYLADHGYITFKNHPVFNEINITSSGIDFYEENFQ